MEELQDCGIEELYGHRLMRVAPQIFPRKEYMWQSLQREPYGTAVWETVLIEGDKTVIVMAREAKADLAGLPYKADAVWKGLSFVVEVNGHNVMPVVVMVLFVPLQTIYEVWFNFYGELGEEVQEAFRLLGEQPNLYIFFHDKGPEAVRKFGFGNSLAQFFHGHYGMISAAPAWNDNDFNEAKRRVMSAYTGEEMFSLQ
jgi:hypothetical protein